MTNTNPWTLGTTDSTTPMQPVASRSPVEHATSSRPTRTITEHCQNNLMIIDFQKDDSTK